MKFRALILVIPAMAIVLSSCAVGPDYRPPPVALSKTGDFQAVQHNGTIAGATQPGQVPDHWWHLYADPELDLLVKMALESNTDLRSAGSNLIQAYATLDIARAARFPVTTETAGTTYGRDETGNAIASSFGAKARDEWTSSDSFSVSYEVDLVGRVRRSIEAAHADTGASEALRDAVRITVVAETTRAYTQICALGEELQTARDSVDVAQRSADIIQSQQRAGAASVFDVRRAETVLEQARAAIPQLTGRREFTFYALAALLGSAPADAPRRVLECVSPPVLKQAIPVGDGRALLERRPDVRQAERRLASATARIGVATASLYPRVTLGGTTTALTNHELHGYSGLAFGVGPLITWSFPNLAVLKAQLRQSHAAGDSSLASFEGAEVQALKEMEQALAVYGAELERRQALARAHDHSVDALRLAQDRYRAGAASVLDLLTSEQSLITAAAAVAGSDALVLTDQVDVFKALGGGWETDGSDPR